MAMHELRPMGIGDILDATFRLYRQRFVTFLLIALIVYVLPRIALAGTQSSVQEAYQQSKLSLPPDWAPMLYNVGWRLMGNRPEYATSSSPPEATPEQPIV